MSGPELLAREIVQNVEKVIVGKTDVVELVVIALISRGHALIEDVPGVGKTMLARSMARSVGCDFRRIQFTPDLLPSDITGVSFYNQKTLEFEFRPGPILSQIVLVDEINRATPKTQSALLEAMAERQVTVEGVTHRLADPFMVMATQNPIEYEGTFPLPEAQLDRFFLRVRIGYPTLDQEIAILDSQIISEPIDDLMSVATPDDIIELQSAARDVYVHDLIKEYIVALTNATRDHQDASLGVSPRASLALMRGAQARSMIDGRDFVSPNDVKSIARAVMAHRLIISPAARMRGLNGEDLVGEVLDSVPVPGAEAGGPARS
ncbi:MAG TPA: MoxR family ATPase [Dehalococcoidia bacterium]|nr:AAA family ATPase [Chloroflexota bacterium]MDP5877673.1 MoxR family ATPase [Dehalococcoidia bacterium]MDP6273717.1 MoxR family ATPase [Dehalococcoidia bacterium]MDP7159646.1 MoxR family ATPase [Dehalococcoidia bacterium]MDP7213710.1 MoxR family ATPase [Dehalococcoidia bacterium]